MQHFVMDDLFCPNLVLAIEICRKNEKKETTEELFRANLENATFANLLSSRVSTSFALNLLLSIYIHICSEQILFQHVHFFRLVLKQQL